MYTHENEEELKKDDLKNMNKQNIRLKKQVKELNSLLK